MTVQYMIHAMSSVFASTVSKSATCSPPLDLSGRKNDAHYTVRDFLGIKIGVNLTARQGRAWKPHGRHQSCISATGQGSPTSGSGIRNQRSSSSTARRLEYDVVIVGAGIIGLATAHRILLNTNMSVALIDGAEPCAGATGAGQGYIWMSHRTPGSPGWALARRSKLLWEELVSELKAEGINPLKAMGWRNTGSLLVASTSEEAEALKQCVAASDIAGVPAEYMSATGAREAEPALSPDYLAAAAFFPDDSQIDARLTVALLQERIAPFSSSGRYKELFQNPVRQFIWSPTEGHIQGVQMQGGQVYCKKAVVVATGAWSFEMMSRATAELGLSIAPPVKPLKGHLLVLEPMKNVQLQHGIMEFEYLSHSGTSSVDVVETHNQEDVLESSLELAMTATLDQNGNLLLGSSREFVGFDTDVQTQVVESIMNRARKFLWGLSDVSLGSSLQSKLVRTGLRPFAADGRPLIGAVEDVPGLFFATGHEGSGLCLALATAEMVVNAIQDIECVVDGSFFSPVGRLLPSETKRASNGFPMRRADQS